MVKKISLVILISSLAVLLTGCVESTTNQTQDKSIMASITPTTAAQSTELKITTTKEGSGTAVVKNGDTIAVHYVGTLLNGAKFDSSRDRNQPFSFQIGNGDVIEGWEKGFIGMKVGEIRKLVIPPAMGYGDRAVSTIPANSYLVFEVELLSIN